MGDEITIECNSAEEAVKLARALADSKKRRRDEQPHLFSEPTDAAPALDTSGIDIGRRADQFRRHLNEAQHRLLDLIASHDEIRIDQLRQELGLAGTRQVSILLGTVSTLARKLGFDWQDLVTYRIEGARQNRTSVYSAGPLLRELVGEPPDEEAS